MSEEFRFREEDHTYWLGDRRLIGVSEAMEAAGLVDYSMVDPEVLKHAMERGTAVHKACHYLDDGDLDWATVSPEIEPYVRAWEKFRSDFPITMEEIEKPRHFQDDYAGTPDRVFSRNCGYGVIDIKTYKPDDVTGVQLAAYSRLAFQGEQLAPAERYGLWLRPDGKYRLFEYKDRGDMAVFLACLTIAKFKGSLK